jgi:hypothetical protein
LIGNDAVAVHHDQPAIAGAEQEHQADIDSEVEALLSEACSAWLSCCPV